MSYSISYTKKFEKSVRKCRKRGWNIEKLSEAISILVDSGTLPAKYRPHKLSGEYSGIWECHIEPDWLLLWQQSDMELILMMVDTGTHSDLF